MILRDRLGRPLRKLRLSLTDRCNLRCAYCMPADPQWLSAADLLRADEAIAIAGAFVACGVSAVRLTGGEPLARPDLVEIVGGVASIDGLHDLSLTTNGIQLDTRAAALRRAGLMRVNISLDTLRGDCFRALARTDAALHARVLRGVRAAVAHFASVKLNAVVIRGVNEQEIVPLLRFGRALGAEVRFIEFMDVTAGWSLERVVTKAEILRRIETALGPATPAASGSDPAQRFTLDDGTRFGIIGSVSEPFCASCDRTRVSATGQWMRCLYAAPWIDLRAVLRERGPDHVRGAIAAAWPMRDDRGAEERASTRTGAHAVGPIPAPPAGIGMHARGG